MEAVAEGQRSGRPWYEAPTTPPLVRELVKLRDVGVLGLRDDVMRAELPLLHQKAYEIHPRARSEYIAVDRLMSKAIEQLEDLPKFQEAALLEFGLGDAGTSKERRRRIWRDVFFISEKTYRDNPKYERRLIRLVAEKLETVGPETPAEPFVSVATTAYVARPDVDAQIANWASQPTSAGWITRNRVCVVGEPGTGKSRAVAENTDTQRRLWVRAETPATLMSSMIRALDEYSIRTDGLTADTIRLKFAGLFNREGNPKLIVIDGIADPMQLDEFLPLTTRIPLIVISTLKPGDSWAPIIEVGDLTAEQASGMVADLCPNIEQTRREALAMLLGRRPSAITQTCAFLNRDADIDVDDFIRALEEDTPTVLSVSAERSERSLVVTYRRMVEQLAVEHEDSLDILGFIAFAGHANVTAKCVTAYLLRHPVYASQRETLAKMRYAAAIRPLVELCLVRPEPERLVTSSLTQALLRRLLADRRARVLFRAINSMVVTVGERDYRFLSELDLFLLGWSPADIASFLLSKFAMAVRLAGMVARRDSITPAADAAGTDDSMRPEMISDAIWETTYLLVRSLEAPEVRDFMSQNQDMVQGELLDDYWETIRLMARGLEDAKRIERKFGALPQPFVQVLQQPPPTLPETIAWLNEHGLKVKKSQHRLQRWQRVYSTVRVVQAFRDHVAEPIGEGDLIPQGDDLLDLCVDLVDDAMATKAYVEKARRSLPDT